MSLRRKLLDNAVLAAMRPPLGLPTRTNIDLRGKRVLLTGASSGIGEAAAEKFVEDMAVPLLDATRTPTDDFPDFLAAFVAVTPSLLIVGANRAPLLALTVTATIEVE